VSTQTVRGLDRLRSALADRTTVVPTWEERR
jgi:hypothetical protein